MPPPTDRHAAHDGPSFALGPVLAQGLLVGASFVVVFVPATVVLVRSASRVGRNWSEIWPVLQSAISLQTLVNTGLYACLIAVFALALAWPAAWTLAHNRSNRGFLAPALVATPLLLPSYLAYAGWGLLRGPNTHFGDWLARQDPALTIWVGKATAVFGMALWVWPLAAFVLVGPMRATAAGLTDLALLDSPNAARRVWVLAGSIRSGIVAAAMAVGLVMVGSAIPLQVAQVPTYSIDLWKVMQLTPDPTGVWVASLPLLVLAVAAAWVITRRVTRQPEAQPRLTEAPARRRGAAVWGLALVWSLTVLVPLGLYLWSLGSWASIPMFWRLSGKGVAQSLRLAVAAGGWGIVLVLATWAAVELGGRAGRRVAAWSLGVFLFAGITPGVLVGVAAAACWGAPPVSDWLGTGVVVLTHLARFGFLAVLAGWWLARVNGREQAWLLQIDGGRSVRAWLAGSVRPSLAAVIGVGLCVGALSLHEIESTVFVLPPGVANLPQQLLDYLHYARDEQLSAAAVNLLGVGVVVAFVGSSLVLRGRAQPVQREGRSTGSLD